MHKLRSSIWDFLFRSRDQRAGRFPWWILPPVRFVYLVVQEFSRNRCQEKASALGFQTVFSLIPAFALALFFFRAFDFSDLGGKVEPMLYKVLKIDKVYLNKPGLSPESKPEDTPAAPPTEPSPPTENTSVPQPKTDPADMTAQTSDPTEGVEASAVPADADRLDTRIQELVDGVYDKLSSGGLSTVSFVLLIAAALTLAFTIEKSLDEIWGSVGRRRLLRRIVMYWVVLTLGPLLIVLSFYLAKQVGINSAIQELAISVAGPLLALYLMYQLMPSAPVHPLTAIAGAFTSAVFLQIASWLFGLYLKHAVGYEKLYGNLALVPIFLFWLWIMWVIVLAGAEISYTLQNLSRLVAEERRRRGAPFIHPGLVALGLVLHAGRAFSSGKGPVDADDLAESSGLPDKLWIRLVDLLRDRGILIDAGPDGSRFIPGRPLDTLRVEEIFATVEDSLVARFDEFWHPEQGQLQSLTNLLTRARQRELGTTSIADLLRMDGEPASPIAAPTAPAGVAAGVPTSNPKPS
jgi:YihY family inner membrane protein